MKKNLIVIAAVLSIILYITGVLSGLYVNKIIQKRVDEDLEEIRSIINSITFDIKNIQLQEFYIDNFKKEEQCPFLKIYTNYMYSQIRTYWENLPSRLEEYEKNNELNKEYLALKREYIRFSLRFWLIANNYVESCEDSSVIPILYFYSKDCNNCIEQGREFDQLNFNLQARNITLIVFPVDGEFDEDTIHLLKRYYNISEYPSTVVRNAVVRGKVVEEPELWSISLEEDFALGYEI